MPKENPLSNVDVTEDLEKLIGDEFGFANRQTSHIFFPETGGFIDKYKLNDGSELAVKFYESTEVLDTQEVKTGFLKKRTLTVLIHKPKVWSVVDVTLSSDRKQVTDRLKEFFESKGYKSQTYDF